MYAIFSLEQLYQVDKAQLILAQNKKVILSKFSKIPHSDL